MSHVLKRAAPSLIGLVAALADLLLWGGSGELHRFSAVPQWCAPAGLVVSFVPLVVRPRWTFRPLICLALFGVLAGIVVVGAAPFVGVSVATYRAAARQPFRLALGALGLAAVPMTINAVNSLDRLSASDANSALGLAVWLVVLLLPWVLGRLTFLAARQAEERERRQEVEAQHELRAERLRLARELHDIISHSVSAMILQAAGARVTGLAGDPRQLAALEAVEKTGVQAMRELHRLLGLLRSAEDDEAPGATLAHESIGNLEPLLESVRACDVEVELIMDGERRDLDPSVDHAAYRVVQEALANVIKHAGRGATAQVHLRWRPHSLKIDIRNGAGLHGDDVRPDLSSGTGLRGLAERLDLVGGRFESGPTQDGAYLVRAELPLTGAPVEPAR